MDDGGHRENGRHKPPHGQWFMQHQPSMKQIMAIMAERDAAIQERNLAVAEKKAALAERDMAVLQRESAISERNGAIMERDNAIATLQYRESTMTSGNMYINESLPMSPVASSEPAKSRQTKRAKEAKAKTSNRKPSKSSKKVKREGEDLNKTMMMLGKSHEWSSGQDMSSGGDEQKPPGISRPDWKARDLGLNQVAFDESTMPVPVCSCTGILRPCYKWGSGGWQSSCCTTSMSMYPLPAVPNKRHARVGGRKMSGGAFNKLISRLAAEGHDLSNPVDLKDHWAKHGTNRYITIR
ncbi:hypothetical protein U1Q18_016102 [Sarracenia purpurea var. burkii]